MGPPDRSTVHAEVTGDIEEPVAVITSSEFALSDDSNDPILGSSDTVQVEVPYENDYDLRETGRFFIRVVPADSATDEGEEPPPLPVNLRVFIDGDLEYDVSSDLRERELQFLYASAG